MSSSTSVGMWRSSRGRDRNDHMKVLYGHLAGQDEGGGGAARSATQPTRLLLGLPRFFFDRGDRQSLNVRVGHRKR